MVKVTASVDDTLKAAVEGYCKSHGVVIDHFIQEALADRLAELDDVERLKQARLEPTRPLAEVIKELKLTCTP